MPCPLLIFKYLEKCVSLLFQFPNHQPSTTGLFSLRKCRSFSCQSHWNLIITLFIALASLHLLWNFFFLHFTHTHTLCFQCRLSSKTSPWTWLLRSWSSSFIHCLYLPTQQISDIILIFGHFPSAPWPLLFLAHCILLPLWPLWLVDINSLLTPSSPKHHPTPCREGSFKITHLLVSSEWL